MTSAQESRQSKSGIRLKEPLRSSVFSFFQPEQLNLCPKSLDHYSNAVETAGFCRDWRNRRIAHRDLKLAIEDSIEPLEAASRDRVRQALEGLLEVLNAITMHYSSSETVFETPTMPGGAISLLYHLDDGLRAEKERRERLEKGTPLEGDLGSRDL